MQQTSVQKKKQIKDNRGGTSMFKKMKHMKNEKGLTLIELLAVIVILAIIAAIAIPAIGNIINNSRDKAVLSDVQAALASAKIAKADGSCTTNGTTVTCDADDIEFSSTKITVNEIVFEQPGAGETAADKTEIKVNLTKALNGSKIPDSIEDEYTPPSNTSGGTINITETKLISVLGGN